MYVELLQVFRGIDWHNRSFQRHHWQFQSLKITFLNSEYCGNG